MAVEIGIVIAWTRKLFEGLLRKHQNSRSLEMAWLK